VVPLGILGVCIVILFFAFLRIVFHRCEKFRLKLQEIEDKVRWSTVIRGIITGYFMIASSTFKENMRLDEISTKEAWIYGFQSLIIFGFPIYSARLIESSIGQLDVI